MTKPLLDVVAELDLKFKSGNEVRVERAIITREEWMELLRGLEAQRVPDGETTKSYHDVAKRLYSLLDDIDSAGDIAKNDDALYRGIVERTQSKKGVFVISCDGYTVRLVDDSMLAAAPKEKK